MRHFFLILFLFITGFIHSNVSAGYIFSQPNIAYSAIAGGTSLGSISSDDELFITNTTGSASNQTAAGFSIGFTFIYDGNTYTQFGVSNNGYIKLGNLPSFSMNSNGYYQNMPSIGDGLLIGACVNDLQGQTGSVLQYLTAGSSPNRTLTVQWSGYRLFNESSGNMNFQIILHETTNVIEISYGSFTYGTGQPGWEATAMAGLYGTSNSDFFLRTHATDWTITTNGGSNSSSISYNGTCIPANDLMFRYTPVVSLPIELISFEGFAKKNVNKILWKVATQTNNEKFILYKSIDAKIWDVLADIPGAGTISSEIDYYFTDQNPYPTTYYMILQYDYDGKSQTFKTISVDNNHLNGVISVRPNPFQGILIIEIGLDINQIYDVKIINMDGEVVFTKTLEGDSGIVTYYMDMTYLSNGSYNVVITTPNSSYSKTFIKQ